jgi:hypothetical protein
MRLFIVRDRGFEGVVGLPETVVDVVGLLKMEKRRGRDCYLRLEIIPEVEPFVFKMGAAKSDRLVSFRRGADMFHQ